MTQNDIRQLTDKRITEIRNTPSIKPLGRVIYVDPDGDDSNDGLSPETPWKTLEKIHSANEDGTIHSGDTVLFRRGGLWRGFFTVLVPNVTYSAYGQGQKPRIYSAPRNYADPSLWQETSAPNVYLCADKFDRTRDVGFIALNGGDIYGIKDIPIFSDKDGCCVQHDKRYPLNGFFDVKEDCHFFHDWRSEKLYFCSHKGNPGDRFDSIELSLRTNTISVYADNVTIDNICIRHTGSHGIGTGTLKNLRVQNCEFGWIGGSILPSSYTKEGLVRAERYGNGVEIYGGCDGYVIENCLFYQIYDAGMTFQYMVGEPDDNSSMLNILFKDNVAIDCYYSIEYFLYITHPTNPSHVDNVVFEGNILSHSAYGMCMQRTDKVGGAHIKAKYVANCGENFVMRNNIFNEGAVSLFAMGIEQKNTDYKCAFPKMEGNTYVQHKDRGYGFYRNVSDPSDPLTYSSDKFGPDEHRRILVQDPTATIIEADDEVLVIGREFEE